MGEAPLDLSIITVVYDEATVKAADGLLKSVFRSHFDGLFEMILVSNGAPDDVLRPISDGYDWLRILRSDRNLGYAGGNNWGMLRSRGRLVLLLNPDIVVEPDALARLVEFVDSHPDIAGATGKLLGDDGKVQVGFNVRGLPTFMAVVFDALLFHRAFAWTGLFRHYLGRDFDYSKAQRAEQPAGACLLVRREIIDQVGVMDESFFPVWYEDVDWCMRMRSYQRELWFTPDAVFHHSGAVSTKDWTKDSATLAKYRNFAYFCKKHFGGPLSILVIISIAIGMLLRSGFVLLGMLLRKDLSKSVKNFGVGGSRAALKGYMKVLWLCVRAKL
nr:glycosyltransferase family 2 protein [Candidatus Coatesbacteria bacterium]